MAHAARRQSASPIGKKGPRKANPKYKRHNRQPWSKDDVKELRQLAKSNTPTGVISLKMGRTPTSISNKAHKEGISLRPSNRSPYNRRKMAAKKRRQRG